MASIDIDSAVSAAPRSRAPSKSAQIENTQANSVAQRYLDVRNYSEEICAPLAIEDYGLQAMASTSPAKWHLAHTSWFFETFLLKPYAQDYCEYHPGFEYLFNSYYNGVGGQYPRHQRSLLSRPTVEEVYAYRRHVNQAMLSLLESKAAGESTDILTRTELGCHHEQQHQELFFTDLKYCLFQNPLYTAYDTNPLPPAHKPDALQWRAYGGQLLEIGHRGDGFCFDNELPRHKQYVANFELADRLVTNSEFMAFMADGGYERPELWLADGWAVLQASPHSPAPLYWVQREGEWWEYTLHGLVRLDPHRPASHLSAYEADAFARWMGCRLPTEFEWEMAATISPAAELHETSSARPAVHPESANPVGSLWQWTSSAYTPYPGFKTAAGAIGEYNGKFMANQLVLRGGSVATSPGHYRHSYRNFFYPPDQWQFTGVRLARES
ncbi:ergothioneine biosynthesis protein EgtB [Halioglobus maricola]|uniref:Ergothioneine biosynthesis protein EgtB n=1 Tax=Halioglobus maricola TaxID=2601894 RepID=A0A5P9NMZ5_9GAMM|nr:ergothioneine biosynthesis protein EgtB [Halioglobus maricola]QFU76866.1 ergothioneine biosynthesis protein EgtB [Halioglobus maricola]